MLNFLKSFREAPANPKTGVPAGKDWVTMPELFKNAGYFTSAAGKIYHDEPLDHDPQSWSYPSDHTAWIKCKDGDVKDPIGSNYCGVTNHSKVKYTDEDLMYDACIKRLKLAVDSGKPFFVGCGGHRPHAPFRVPQGFYGTELYPNSSSGGDPIQPPRFPYPPKNFPWMSGQWQDGDQSDPHLGCPDCIMPADHQREVRRWRKAAVSWADHVHGKIYSFLKELDPAVLSSTIIVFTADHGYNLGEQNAWSKKSVYHFATRVPLLIHVPWMAASHGKRTDIKAELIDLYPTLADLAGLTSKLQPSVQGMSLKSVLENPEAPSQEVADKAMISQIGRCACKMYDKFGKMVHECDAGACIHTPINSSEYDFMGYSIYRTLQLDSDPSLNGNYRYSAWLGWQPEIGYANWNNVSARELYDLRGVDPIDPDFYDDAAFAVNVAGESKFAPVIEALHAELERKVKSYY